MKYPTKDIRHYLRSLAGWTWQEQKRAFGFGLSLQEETITEMLLLQAAKDHAKRGLKVDMYTKPKEGENGADWEWIIDTDECDIALRVQAKRLYHRSQKKDYGGLNLSKKQATKLIAHAGGCTPVYVFYNHAEGQNSNMFPKRGEVGFRGRSLWGCTIAAAVNVERKNSNELKNLLPIMKPWHRMIDHNGKCDIDAALGLNEGNADRGAPPSRREMVEHLRARDTEFLENYLSEHRLKGAAWLDFRSFRS